MNKKWYNYFVSTEGEGGEPAPPQEEEAAPDAKRDPSYRPFAQQRAGAPQAPRSAAQTVAEIAASVATSEPEFTTPVNNPSSFAEIYSAAEIRTPQHGYSIFKVSEMLESEHIRSLPPDVKRSAIRVALDAAGVKVEEVIQDAVARDRALDKFEEVQQKALAELEARKTQENRKIQAEIDRLVAEHQARIQANNAEVAKEKERISRWRAQKQQEEQRIADAVAPFVSANPISAGGAPPPRPPVPKGT